MKWRLKDWITSKAGALCQAIFQRRACILDELGGNQIHLYVNEKSTKRGEREEKKEEMEKIPDEEWFQLRESGQEGFKWVF